MSAKSSRIVKKNPTPRAMTEIQKSYQELCLKAGQAQYQIKVLDNELKFINDQLLQVNREASARAELDKTSQSTQQAGTNEQA